MSQRRQHLRQEQNELGYQHTLVSSVKLYLLMSARKITCDIYVHKISLPPLDVICSDASLMVGQNKCN
jgi:hypothetical protein